MPKSEDSDKWLSEIDLATVFSMLRRNGSTEILYKVLPKNANSKNQVYLGGKDPSEFSKLPSGEMTAHLSVSEKEGKQEAIFQAKLELFWLDKNGNPQRAPEAKLIYYPQYPEVRFSGFLKGCHAAPSSLWTKEKRGQEPDRILVFGVGNEKKIFGITLPPESPAAKEIRVGEPRETYGALNVLPMPGEKQGDSFIELMRELCSIHSRGWVSSSRLDSLGNRVPCNASNCNGNTLESLLGIRSNGYSLPDFKGWEVKARLVPDSNLPGPSVVTLFTPEPTSGMYKDKGVVEFIRRYGYPDMMGRPDRLNVGGVYRAGQPAHDRTGLRLVLDGFEPETNKFLPTGAIQLVDRKHNLAAAWPFVKLMDHWKSKHAHAAYVPSQASKIGQRQYRFGRNILLGEGAEFRRFLRAVHEGRIYYDPGIKLEGASTEKPRAKKRSQFRVSSKNLQALYVASRIVDACEVTRE